MSFLTAGAIEDVPCKTAIDCRFHNAESTAFATAQEYADTCEIFANAHASSDASKCASQLLEDELSHYVISSIVEASLTTFRESVLRVMSEADRHPLGDDGEWQETLLQLSRRAGLRSACAQGCAAAAVAALRSAQPSAAQR